MSPNSQNVHVKNVLFIGWEKSKKEKDYLHIATFGEKQISFLSWQ